MSPKKVDNSSRYNQLEAGTQRARPVLHEHAKEIQPYNKIAKLPIAGISFPFSTAPRYISKSDARRS